MNADGNRPGEEGAGLHRLPPGRHGLPREFVVKNQRDRIFAAMIRTVAERGYHETTVKDVGALASVSRTTFYALFDSKEDCYFQTYAMVAEALLGVMGAAADQAEGRWPARVRAQLAALLDALASNPDLVRFALTAPPAAGGAVAERHRAFLDDLREALVAGRPGNVRRPGLVAEQGMVGGVVALVAETVEAGEGQEVAQLLPDLTELILTPYLGRERAALAAHAS